MSIKTAAVTDEIAAVLKKHDCTAFTIVLLPNELSYCYHVEASWSCAKLENTPEGALFRMKADGADFSSKEEQKKCVEATVGMLVSMINQCERSREDMMGLLAHISKHVGEITHNENILPRG